MPAWLYSAYRTLAQTVGASAVAWLASKGITLPGGAENWLVQTVFIGGGFAVYVGGVRWLEDRSGDSLPARAARWLARVLNGGASKPPVYPEKVQ